MKIFNIGSELREVLDELTAAAEYTPEISADGELIDDDGNVIDDFEEFQQRMFSAMWEKFEAAQDRFIAKAAGAGAYIKELRDEAAMLKKEEDEIKRRRKAKETAAARISEYLLHEMLVTDTTRIDEPCAALSVRNNPESVEVPDEAAFIMWAKENRTDLLRYSEPEISKTTVKKALKNGEEIPFCFLDRKKSLVIK